MRRILLPLEQTDRSLKALQYFRKHYSPEEAAVVLLMVDESLGYSAKQEEEEAALKRLEEKLELLQNFLKGYEVYCKADLGKAGQRIVKCAREYEVSLIAMTKSSKEDMLSQIGRTTQYVLINAPCNVCIVSETRDSSEYRGLVYTKAKSVVNLRGQIGDKQSECMLPSVAADCNYHFDVTVGKVRFYHTAYNPNTGNWDTPPADDQQASVDIAAGESVDVLVKMGSVDGKADRIRIVNRGMKQEAVFSYIITPINPSEREELPAVEELVEEPAPVVEELVEESAPVVEELVEEPTPIVEEEPVQFEEEIVEEEPAVEEFVEEPVQYVPDTSHVEAFRNEWSHDDYFAEVFENEVETDILNEYIADWRLCSGDEDIAYVPDTVIAAAETEMVL